MSSVQNISRHVFGRHFMIESDHKSLEQISMKNLTDALVHLQRMLFWLQDYDFTIKFCPGEEIVVADTLFRYSPEDTLEILLYIYICQPHIHWCWEEMRLPTCNPRWPTIKCPCIHNHCWMARWYQGYSKSIVTIPCRGWTYHTWRSNHHSPRKEEGLATIPSRTLGHIEVPIQGKTICILAWNHPLSDTLTSETKATTEANTTTWVTMATTRSWLHDFW